MPPVVVQSAQRLPPLPQALFALPTWQLELFQQPAQQLPLRHLPPEHTVPSATALVVQLPLGQLACWQAAVVVQLLQAAPALPHRLTELPG